MLYVSVVCVDIRHLQLFPRCLSPPHAVRESLLGVHSRQNQLRGKRGPGYGAPAEGHHQFFGSALYPALINASLNPNMLSWAQVTPVAPHGFGGKGKAKGWLLVGCTCMCVGWGVTMLCFKTTKPLRAWAYKKIFGAEKCSSS